MTSRDICGPWVRCCFASFVWSAGVHISTLKCITDDLIAALRPLRFGSSVAFVYNPLIYARKPFDRYVTLYGNGPREVLFVGMNPGPWGMAQTGIPFGEVTLARDWLRVAAKVGKPEKEHPKRPVQGFDCHRSEVSGRRLWGWAKDRFGSPDNFFRKFYVANYCPLCFLGAGGRNLTPDKLPARVKSSLQDACDEALRRTVDYFKPRFVVGVGKFAALRAQHVLSDTRIVIGDILHPSPASPKANANWAAQAEAQLRSLGIEISDARKSRSVSLQFSRVE